MSISLTILSILPFFLLFSLIIWKKWPALYAIPLTWFITLISLLFFWKLQPNWIAASFLKGVFITIEIMLIIFGAVWLIEILKSKSKIKIIQSFLSSISPDARIQALIITWLFGSLIEGVAGFGTPAALTAPLLFSLGFNPILAVVISLIANSTAVSFGAAGTPILLGIATSNPELTRQTLEEISKNVALIHLFASIIIPLSIVYLTISFKSKNKTKDFLEILPFTILAWLAFVIPYYLTAKFLGPELPSIIGALVGLCLISLLAHYKILTPKKIIFFQKVKTKNYNSKEIFSAILPYIILVLLLSLSRTIPLIKNYLYKFSIETNNILATNISYQFLPLFTPSFYLILTSIIFIFLFKANKKEIKNSIKITLQKIKYPTISLIFAVSLVQLILVSGNGNSNFQSIPLILANLFSNLKNSFVIISPFIGMLGSFIAGSNTVSNLLFGTFQSETAKNLGISLITILSLQVVGGAIGNMIAIHNILAAQATVNLKNQEGKIIRKTIGVALIYGILAALIGLILINR